MKNRKSVFTSILAICFGAIIFSSCENVVRDIPGGYIGKKLNPTGWDKDILEAGQVDIGDKNSNGTSTLLVLLEATSITVKEQFLSPTDAGADKEDHRVRTKDGTPLAVDIYVQIAVPTDLAKRNSIFNQITPEPVQGQDRVSVIRLATIYERLAKMTIRGNTRAMFATYKNADAVMENYAKINAEINKMVIDVARDSKAPFEVINAQLSNVKEDETILASKNKLVAAANEVQAIEQVGDAIRKNPYYLEARKLDVLEKMGASSKNSLIIMDTKNSAGVSILADPNK